MTTLFEAEIREQPAALRRLLASGRDAAEAAAGRIRGKSVRFAVLAARGSSDNAARYGQYVLGIRNRLVAALATPSLFTQYHAAPSWPMPSSSASASRASPPTSSRWCVKAAGRER